MEWKFIPFAWYVATRTSRSFKSTCHCCETFWIRGGFFFQMCGKKSCQKFLSTCHSAKIQPYELMWGDVTRLFPPICTRWLPTRDWVRSLKERDFYNKFSHPQHQQFRKSGFGFLSGSVTGRQSGCEWKCTEKKCKQSQCARDGKLSIGNDNAVHSEKLSEIEMKIWFSKRRSRKKRSQTPVVRLEMKDEKKVTIK